MAKNLKQGDKVMVRCTVQDVLSSGAVVLVTDEVCAAYPKGSLINLMPEQVDGPPEPFQPSVIGGQGTVIPIGQPGTNSAVAAK